MKMMLFGLLALATLPAWAQPTNQAPAASDSSDQKEKVSYSLGMNIGTSLKRAGFEVDVDTVAGAIKDVLADKKLKMTEEEARKVMMTYQQELRTKREAERLKQAETNKKKGEEFLAANKKKEGVKTKTVTLQDGSTAELQYKVLAEGAGNPPSSNDTVNVNYRGTLIDGREFDSSSKHGDKPAKFQVNRVIKGWTEILQMMKPGAKYQVFIPSSLAYGDFPSGPIIEPGSTLIFDVELVSVEPAAAASPAQPLTSDIIRVPSAEELKQGKKIEVIKPEDAARIAAEEAAKQKKQEKK